MESVSHDRYMHHFSHPHPLELTHPQTQTLNQALIPPCSACKLQSSGSMYTCKTCNNFTLHVSCTQMPQSITHHQSHPSHPLSLLPKTIHAGGIFHCDGCGHPGDGFSYRCDICDFDLHMLCVSKPMTITHQAHLHQLRLTFAPPYNQTNKFTCHICQHPGANQWLYRCSSCEFDAHLDCATNVYPTRPVSQPRSLPRPQQYNSFSGANQGPVASGMNHNQFTHHSQSMGAPPPVQNSYQRPSAASTVLDSMLGVFSASAQVVAQEIVYNLMNHNVDSGGNDQDPGYDSDGDPSWYQ